MEDDAVMEAAECDDVKRLQDLLKCHSLDPKEANHYQETALMLCAACGALKCLAYLLPLSDAKATDRRGWTALMWAAHTGKKKGVQLLLPVSDLHAKDARGDTALMIAQAENNKAAVELLQSVQAQSA